VFLETLYGEEGVVNQGAADPVRLFSLKPSQTDGIPNVWVLTGHDAYEKRKKYNLEWLVLRCFELPLCEPLLS